VKNSSFQSVTDQVTETLRKGILQGRWRGTLPGRNQLAEELGVNHKTVEAAAQQLIKEGLLVPQKPPLRRRIVLPDRLSPEKINLRIRILPYEAASRSSAHMIKLLDQLNQLGFAADFARKSLSDLRMRPDRVARFVAKIPADAWVVESASREVLEWFASQPIPSLAISGRFTGLPIAATSPRYKPALIRATRRLFELGHRRIVMLVREERRRPHPALVEQAFLDTLNELGITTGNYNLPDWQDDAAGLRDCLKNLFSHTPPTALILGDNNFLPPVQQYLARRGLHAPEHYSLVCPRHDPAFDWCEPKLAHFSWDTNRLVRRVRNWAKQVAQGKHDRRQHLFNADFIEGGTIGPVPGNHE